MTTENSRRTGASEERRNGQKTQTGRSRKKGISGIAVLLIILITAAAACAVSYFMAYRRLEKEYQYKVRPIVMEEGEAFDALRNRLTEGSSVTVALRQSFPNYLITYHGNRYQFFPVNYDLKMHHLEKKNVLTLDSGEWQYAVKDKVISYKGVDVSSHQGKINWKKAAEDGVTFAIARAVYRGYGEEGNLVTDSRFRENAEGITAAGISLGTYLFSQAVNEQEMDEEIDLLLETIAPYQITGPVVMDIEFANDGAGRADTLSPDERTDLALHFVERIREAGYRPMLYFNFESALLLLNQDRLDGCEKWYASYNREFYYPYYYSLWQYSSTGHVDGIDGDVDLDMCFEKF